MFGDDKSSARGNGGGGAGDGLEKDTAAGNDGDESQKNADWKRQASEDGIAVLTAVVASVTAAAVKTAARRESGGGGGGRGFGRGAGGGPTGVDGLEEFGIQESDALSSVCDEALRALVRCQGEWFVR